MRTLWQIFLKHVAWTWSLWGFAFATLIIAAGIAALTFKRRGHNIPARGCLVICCLAAEALAAFCLPEHFACITYDDTTGLYDRFNELSLALSLFVPAFLAAPFVVAFLWLPQKAHPRADSREGRILTPIILGAAALALDYLFIMAITKWPFL